jgi:hypothetical protein
MGPPSPYVGIAVGVILDSSDKKERPARMNGDDMTFIHGFARHVGGVALLCGESRLTCLEFCEENRELVLSSLPFSLAEIADTCGFQLMFDIVLAYGGRKLYLPTHVGRFAEQTCIGITPDAYARWRENADCAGQFDVPSAWGLFLALRRAAIRIALSSDWPTEALLSTFGLTRRQLRESRKVSRPGA